MGPALVRPVLALLLLAGFLARSTGFERLHPCPPKAAEHGARHEGHEHGRHVPPGDRCECVGQLCSTSVAVLVAREAVGGLVAAHDAALVPAGALVSRGASSHLLPFAHGPPA
ncbi:MAG TPA: hypothetical protein VEB59_06195 [Gemmatimonadales bacterium]|nr:hypothetical protein [Gemmatimonadales bacterium]